jgi:integrase
MLNIAVEWGLMAVAPRIKPLKAPAPDFDFLTIEESDRLVAAADPEWRAMVVTALNTGMRQGELLALRWEDVDLVAGRLVVRRTDWRGVIGSPKGGKPREVPLNSVVARALKTHRHLRGPLVFCREDGSALTYQRLFWPLRRACTFAGLRQVQWHTLRHSFASALTMRGVPLKAVQELLGHATIQMTMRYAHLSPDVRKDAVEAITSRRLRQPDGNAAGALEEAQ